MHIIFEVKFIYYLPQYLPIYRELLNQGCSADFVFFEDKNKNIIEKIISAEQLPNHWVDNSEQALDYYKESKPDWVFFGNRFRLLEELHNFTKSAQLGHGVGPKASYYSKSSTPMTVRFVEGEYRCQRLRKMFPNNDFIDVGFSKLDPIFNGTEPRLNLRGLGLDPNKKTIVYAPTFYPSSIEKFPQNWPELFSEYNILLKPHYLSLIRHKLKNQRKLLQLWANYPNVYLAEAHDYSLVPFLATADILISDASSAIIEFAALNKPVVWCRFLKLRWNYRGPFKFRIQRRLDEDYQSFGKIAQPVDSFKTLKSAVKQQLDNPQQLAEQRLAQTDIMMGKVDGKASIRIVNYLLSNLD